MSFEQDKSFLSEQVKLSFEQVLIGIKLKHVWYLEQVNRSFEQGNPLFEQVKKSFEQVLINMKYKHVWYFKQVKWSFKQGNP